jgi:hypothetical protein
VWRLGMLTFKAPFDTHRPFALFLNDVIPDYSLRVLNTTRAQLGQTPLIVSTLLSFMYFKYQLGYNILALCEKLVTQPESSAENYY